MDDLDVKALSILCDNGRVSWSDLAHQLNLSAPAAAERVHKLEERGIIRGYTAVLDPASLGYGLSAFVAITLGKIKYRKSFLRTIKKLPEVLECHQVAGEEDFLLKILVRDIAHLNALVGDALRSIDGVQRSKTTVVLSTVKESTSVKSRRFPIAVTG